jgi:hypothetical protein
MVRRYGLERTARYAVLWFARTGSRVPAGAKGGDTMALGSSCPHRGLNFCRRWWPWCRWIKIERETGTPWDGGPHE